MEARRVQLHAIEPLAVPGTARPDARPLRVRKTGNSEFDVALERLFDTDSEPVVAKPSESGVSPTEESLLLDVSLPERGPVRFSRHAQARLESRGVELGVEDQDKLDRAVDALDRRGGHEALVMFADRAYIVGVPQRMVITVFDRSEALGHVFTNIDSTYVDA